MSLPRTSKAATLDSVTLCTEVDVASVTALPFCDTSDADAAELQSALWALEASAEELNMTMAQAAWPVRKASGMHLAMCSRLFFVHVPSGHVAWRRLL
jgi:hypothetical protein